MKTEATFRKATMVLAFALMVSGCQKESITGDVKLKSDETTATDCPYSITSSTSDGYSFTFEITKTSEASEDIDFILVKLIDCSNEYIPIDLSKIAALKVNGEDYLSKPGAIEFTASTCFFGDSPNAWVGYFFKVNFEEGINYPVFVEMTITTQVFMGNIRVQAGDGSFCGGECSGYSFGFDGLCNVLCKDWHGETAWANGQRYISKGTWATYTPYSENNTVILYAGQNMDAGTVHFSMITPENKVVITINLIDGWEFAAVDENVKIQDYMTAPAEKPSPGLFQWKATADGQSFQIEVPANNFYGVHVDLGQWVEVECPEAIVVQ